MDYKNAVLSLLSDIRTLEVMEDAVKAPYLFRRKMVNYHQQHACQIKKCENRPC